MTVDWQLIAKFWEMFAKLVSGSGTVVTAIATVCLWLVTRTLAKETKRMADAGARAQVVATLNPNKWSRMAVDLDVTNTGNATAFDIEVNFDPPLDRGKQVTDIPMPLQNISLLKPGQSISSYLGSWNSVSRKTYKVNVSWSLEPGSKNKEYITYTINMNDYEGLAWLGAPDASVQIAEQIKKLRDDWRGVPKSGGKIEVDIYTAQDRAEYEKKLEEMWARQNSKRSED